MLIAPSSINFLWDQANYKWGIPHDEKVLADIGAKFCAFKSGGDAAVKNGGLFYPKIQVAHKDGTWFALNSSHLSLFHELEKRGKCGRVLAEVVPLTKIPVAVQKGMVLKHEFEMQPLTSEIKLEIEDYPNSGAIEKRPRTSRSDMCLGNSSSSSSGCELSDSSKTRKLCKIRKLDAKRLPDNAPMVRLRSFSVPDTNESSIIKKRVNSREHTDSVSPIQTIAESVIELPRKELLYLSTMKDVSGGKLRMKKNRTKLGLPTWGSAKALTNVNGDMTNGAAVSDDEDAVGHADYTDPSRSTKRGYQKLQQTAEIAQDANGIPTDSAAGVDLLNLEQFQIDLLDGASSCCYSSSDYSDFDKNDYFSDTDSDYDEALTCNVCDRSFCNTRLLARHQLKKRHYGCSICDSIFPNLSTLECHKEQLDHWSEDEDYDDDDDFGEGDFELTRTGGCGAIGNETEEIEEMERLL